MKRNLSITLGFVTALGLGIGIGRAQDAAPAKKPAQSTNAAPAQPLILPFAAVESSGPKQATNAPILRLPELEAPKPIPESGVRYGGLISQAGQMKQPLQLFNPLAPPEYGDGLQNLSLNPETGRAEGVTLFSIHFWHKSDPNKPRKNTRKQL